VIELRDVHKSFGDNHVLRGLSLRVDEGETLVVLGRSGSGKSVTLKIIVGLLEPDSGSVRVNDVDIVNADREALREVRRGVAFLFQTGALVNWMTVRENVALPLVEERKQKREEIDKRVDEALKSLGMAAAADQLPENISGGMRKRAALCRVLVQDPQAVLYDEPTAGLDPILGRTVAAQIHDEHEHRKRAALVVTHDLELAFTVADRIGLHHEGQLVEVGTPEEFRRSRHPVVRAFLDGTGEPPQGEQGKGEPAVTGAPAKGAPAHGEPANGGPAKGKPRKGDGT
jgi:phospholipid/cholesterol/gamma-HCH transport system ATP-binding protein